MHFVVLYATFAANGKSGKIAAALSAAFKTAAVSFAVYENEWPEQLPENTGYVVLIGGDGTFNYYVNRYPACTIPVILMAGGTGNDFYWKIFGDKKPALQFQDVLQLASGEKIDFEIAATDVGQFTTDGGMPRFFLNSVGLGFDGEVLRDMKTIRWLGGHIGYLVIVLKKMFSYREPAFEFITPGSAYKQSCTLVNIANSSRTGGGFLISPHASVNDNQLNLFHCFVPTLWSRLRTLSQVEKGNHIKNKSVVYKPVDALTVKANRKLYSQMDGELIEGQEHTFSLAGWKLPLLVFGSAGAVLSNA